MSRREPLRLNVVVKSVLIKDIGPNLTVIEPQEETLLVVVPRHDNLFIVHQLIDDYVNQHCHFMGTVPRSRRVLRKEAVTS